MRLVGVRARRGGLLVGHPLRELPKHLKKMELRVVAIYRDGRAVPPEGDTVIAEGDEVFFLAAHDDIAGPWRRCATVMTRRAAS